MLVETSEDESPTILIVAKFIGELHQGAAKRTELAETPARRLVAECEALLERGQHVALLARLLEQSHVLFTKASSSDAETCLLLMANLVPRLPEKEALEAAHQLCIAVSTDAGPGDQSAPLRLRVLLALFNLMPFNYGRYTVLMRLLQYGTHASLSDSLLAVTKRVDVWVKEWELGMGDVRALYLALANAFRSQQGSREHFSFLIKYLSTFEGTGESIPVAEIRAEAMRAAVEFMASPDVFQCDLLDLGSVQQLQSDPQAGPVFALLGTMLTGKLGDFVAFTKANPGLLERLELSQEGVLTKVRLLSLAALGSESNSGEISYAQVKQTLQVEESEVEQWIVKAIGLKLLEAKMDQLRQVVVFNRCTQRVFGDAQWQELRSKLGAWKSNLGNVCKMVHNTRITMAAQADRS